MGIAFHGKVHSADDLCELVTAAGFLPFFANEIPGFSVEEFTPPELWLSDTLAGPWEWKGPVALTKTCIYGKFFRNKAGFISLDWVPDFVNFRRDGYDYDARFDDGLASFKDKKVYDTVAEHRSLLTGDLKRQCNYRKDGNRGFETVITRLQMQSYICISNFEYKMDRFGRQYGWGVARYSTPEAVLGSELVTSRYNIPAEHSKQKIVSYLQEQFPTVSRAQIEHFMR